MSNEDEATAAAIETLSTARSKHAPRLWASLRPPAPTAHVDAVRRTIRPWELPAPVETWLRFCDGSGGQRFPVVAGHFLSARYMTEHYVGGLEFKAPGLLAISYENHCEASIELQQERPQVVLDTSLATTNWRAIAPNFASVLNVIAQLADDGFLSPGYPPIDDPFDENWQASMNVISERWIRSMASEDWSGSPVVPLEWFESWQDSPAEWGEFPD